ncbi:ribbon-helix-helix protein, CopG family [Helicobacter sp. 23-1045]
MKSMINLRLDNDILDMLDSAAREMNLTRTKLIERAILAYQDKIDEMVSDKILDDIKAGKRKAISLDEFFAKTGLDNV